MQKAIKVKASIKGGKIEVPASIGATVVRVVGPPVYRGAVAVTPSSETQVLETKERLVRDDITVNPAPTEYLSTDHNGTFTPSSGKVGFSAVTVDVNPDLRPLSVSENGQYSPDGFDGYSDVTVDVEPNLTSLAVTENGLYLPESGTDGFDRVSVDVPVPSGSTTITQNGTYNVEQYAEAVVDTDIQWDGVLYPVTDETDEFYADHVFNAKYISKLYAGDTVIIEVLGRGHIFSFRGGQPTSGYLQDYSVGNRTSGNTHMRFTIHITEDTSKFILGGYQWTADGSHSGYDYYCGYGEYLKWKVIHAT